MYQYFQIRDIIVEILDLPESKFFGLEPARTYKDEKLDLYIVTFVMSGEMSPNWHLENHANDLYIVYDGKQQRRALLNTKMVDGNPSLEDSAKKVISEAIMHSSNTLATVIISLFKYTYLYERQKSNQYKETYPPISQVYDDDSGEFGIEVSIGNSSPMPIDAETSPYKKLLYTPVDEINDVDIDAGYFQNVVVGKNEKNGVDITEKRHVKIFNIMVDNGVISFTRYTMPRKNPLKPSEPPKQFPSSHTNRVKLADLNLESKADTDDDANIIKHSLSSWLNASVKADTRITDQIGSIFSRDDHMQILGTYNTLRTKYAKALGKRLGISDPNKMTQAQRIAFSSKLQTECIPFDIMYDCYKAHNCEPVISAKMTSKGVAIQYSTTRHDVVATLYVDVDPIYIDRSSNSLVDSFMPVYGDARPTLEYDTGDGTMKEIELKNLRDAMNIIRDLMAFHLVLRDIKDLGQYIFVDSLDNPLPSDDKLVISALYSGIESGKKAFAYVYLSTLTNPNKYKLKMEIMPKGERKSIVISDIRNRGTGTFTTEFSSSNPGNIYTEGVQFEKDSRKGIKPQNISGLIVQHMLHLSDKNQYSTASGKVIDAAHNQQTETENILRVRNDDLYKKIVAVREAFVNTFGHELTDGTISNIYAITDRKTKNIAVEFRVKNGAGGVFDGEYRSGEPTIYCSFTNAVSKPLELVTGENGTKVLDQEFMYWYLLQHHTNYIAQKARRMMMNDPESIPEKVALILNYGKSQISTAGRSLQDDFNDMVFDDAVDREFDLEGDY